MEVVLTRLRDFSCKDTSFDNCTSAVRCRDSSTDQKVCRGERDADRLDIENSLAWLRKELVRSFLDFSFKKTWDSFVSLCFLFKYTLKMDVLIFKTLFVLSY